MVYGSNLGKSVGISILLVLMLSSCGKPDEYHVLKKDVQKREAALVVQPNVPEVMPTGPQAPSVPIASNVPVALNVPQVAYMPEPVRAPVVQAPQAALSAYATVISRGGKMGSLDPAELDFMVENKTGKTVYVSCFAWERKNPLGYWRWDKSPVYKIDDNASVIVDVDTIREKQDRDIVYGYLAIHADSKEAEDATFELLDDKKKLDLDLLVNLKGKKVTLSVEKYGFKGEFFEYDFLPSDDGKKKEVPELDFVVENRTGKTILATCFVYEKKAKGSWIAATEEKDDMVAWRWDKTPCITLLPNTIGLIDVDTILSTRDRSYVRGYLAVFDEDEAKLEQESTLELVETYRKLNLGDLNQLKGKKVVVDIEKYGIEEDFLDYIVKPVSKIDFSKLYK
jgi:hypothetical protein